MAEKHLSDEHEHNAENLDEQIQATTGHGSATLGHGQATPGHGQTLQTNEAGLIPKNIGEGIARGVEIAGGGLVGGLIGGIVDHLHHQQAAPATPPAATPPATPAPTPPASSTGTGSAPYQAPAAPTPQGPPSDAITQTNETHQSLEAAQRAAEQHMAEVAAARQRARDEYRQRMAAEDAEREANRQDAESQRQSLEEGHRARGEYGFTGGDSVASADSGNQESGSSSGV